MAERRMKVLLPVALLAGGAAIVALLFLLRPTAETRPPAVIAPMVEVQTLAPEPVRFTVRTQGTVVPRTESELIPQV